MGLPKLWDWGRLFYSSSIHFIIQNEISAVWSLQITSGMFSCIIISQKGKVLMLIHVGFSILLLQLSCAIVLAAHICAWKKTCLMFHFYLSLNHCFCLSWAAVTSEFPWWWINDVSFYYYEIKSSILCSAELHVLLYAFWKRTKRSYTKAMILFDIKIYRRTPLLYQSSCWSSSSMYNPAYSIHRPTFVDMGWKCSA